jgi:DUF4097 and DUF4098 domain-containing protein YvlB
MRLILPFVIAGLVTAALPAGAQDAERRTELRDMVRSFKARTYQGRNNGPEQTERFSRKVRVGRDGRVSISNISGDIVVTAGSGDEVSIDAVKRTRSGQGDLASVRIEVEERGGRVDVQTLHTGRNDRVSVDYTVVMPAAASVDVHSVSGSVKVTGVRGSVRAETVSGNVEYAGTIVRNGRYEITSHSGTVRLGLANPSGFELNANSFSGSVRSELPLTIGGDSGGRERDAGDDRDRGRRGGSNNRNMRATFGDGSATLTVRTFSGDIIITKR